MLPCRCIARYTSLRTIRNPRAPGPAISEGVQAVNWHSASERLDQSADAFINYFACTDATHLEKINFANCFRRACVPAERAGLQAGGRSVSVDMRTALCVLSQRGLDRATPNSLRSMTTTVRPKAGGGSSTRGGEPCRRGSAPNFAFRGGVPKARGWAGGGCRGG